MAIRSILARRRLQEEEGGGEGGGSGGQNQGGDDGGNKDDKNNSKDNLISHENLWDAASDDKSGDNGDDNNANADANKGDPNEKFNSHVDSLDFSTGIDMAASMTAIQNGDAEAFGKLIQQIGANAYRNSIVDANKVVQQRVDKMADSVKADVSSSNATSDLVKEMNTQLPFTKNPAFAPVAQLTLTQFMQKGVPPQKAIEEVGKYFQNLSGEVGKMNPGAPGGRPAGNLGGGVNSNNAGNQGGDEPEWLEFLGGPAV